MKESFRLIMILLLVFTCLAFTGRWITREPAPAKSGFQILKYNNPDVVADLGVGLWAWPLPMDYDRDGDMDMLVSCPDKPFNGVYFFENKSGASMPVFEAPVRLSASLKDVQLSYVDAQPRLLVPGSEIKNFSQSFGQEKQPLFAVDSILKDFPKKPRFNQWKLVDFEGDGDEDIVVGVDDWNDYGWDNAYNASGDWTRGPLHGYVYVVENVEGKYVNRGRLNAGGKELDVYGAPSPNFADFDHDGDLDLICGEFLDRFTWFENTGNRQKPVYAKGRFLENATGLIKMDLEMIIPVAVDWNNDGFIDLVVGDEDGRVALVENTGRLFNKLPAFKSPVYFRQKPDNVKFGALATPVGVDWDNDGDDDLISGNSAGYIAFIENLGGYPVKWQAPKLLQSNGKTIRVQAGPNGSIQGPAEAKWGYTTLAVADWDGDGLKDVVVNSIWGRVIWFKNTGSKNRPVLVDAGLVKVDWGTDTIPKPDGTWWRPAIGSLAPQWRTTPYVIDWNSDGLNDLVMLDHEGYLSYFERFKKGNDLWMKPGKRIFFGTMVSGFDQRHSLTDSSPGPLRLNTGKYGQSGRRKFTMADWDGDGKKDLLVNSLNVTVMNNVEAKDGRFYFNNAKPVDDLALAGHDTSPTTVDWNKDGLPDLLVGAEDGHFYYLPNPRTKK